MTFYELRIELLAIASESESRAELIGALEELLQRADEPENTPCGAPVAEIYARVA